MFLVSFLRGGCYWLLMCRGQGSCTLHPCIRHVGQPPPPTMKINKKNKDSVTVQAPNVRSAKIEKICCNLTIYLILGTFQNKLQTLEHFPLNISASTYKCIFNPYFCYLVVLFWFFLKYGWFTALCQFLLYSKVAQLYIYIYIYTHIHILIVHFRA